MTHCPCHGFVSKKCPTARARRRDRTVAAGRERLREGNQVINDAVPRHFNHATEDFIEPGIPADGLASLGFA